MMLTIGLLTYMSLVVAVVFVGTCYMLDVWHHIGLSHHGWHRYWRLGGIVLLWLAFLVLLLFPNYTVYIAATGGS